MILSIIMPVYNVASYLEYTVISVLSQTFEDFELLLIDDGSTDGSSELCDELAKRDRRIRVIHQVNSGVSEARNRGVKEAKGDFIGFVDSDDLIEPDMYLILFDVQAKTNAEIVQCRHNRNNSIENTERSIDIKCVTGYQFVKNIFGFTSGEYTNQVSLCSKIYKRELFDGIIFPVGQTFEDEQETYKICLKADKIAMIDDELYHYVKRDNSIITGVSARKLLDRQMAVMDRIHYLPTKMPELKDKCCSIFYNDSVQTLLKLYALGEKEAYKKSKAMLLKEKKMVYQYLNKYQKMYLIWLRIPILEKWLMKTNYEPIQSIIRRIRGINDKS